MALLDLTGLTMNTEEAQSVSEAILEQVLDWDTLTSSHEFVTGIEHDTQIPFIGTLGLVGKAITGCGRTANGSTIPLTQKVWSPKHVGDRLEHCAKDVNVLLKIFNKAKKMNPDYWNRIGSEELGVVLARLTPAVQEMLVRLVWFGDTAADTVANSGTLKNGTDKTYFNILDGLFKQLFTDIPSGNAYHVNITENEGADYAAQTSITSGTAIGYLRAMWKKADARLKAVMAQGGDLVWNMTPDLFDEYVDYMEDKSFSFTLKEAQDGSSSTHYRGIPINVRYDWQSIIEAYYDNGTKYDHPNRILLTSPGNIPIGTLSQSDMGAVESWYSQDDKVNRMDIDMTLDAKHLEDYLTVFAY